MAIECYSRDGRKDRDRPRVFVIASRENRKTLVDAICLAEDAVVYSSSLPCLALPLALAETAVCFLLIDEQSLSLGQEIEKAIDAIHQSGVPLYPVLEKEGLLGEYQRLLGDIQFSFFPSSKALQRRFVEQVNRYFALFLYSSSEIKRIKEAFGRRVFLSYRKKDSSLALSAMEAIHSGEENYDIGIWYDYFLNAGEDFNKEILEELHNAEAMALLVTPSLLEEGNYIIRYEYPWAKETGVEVVPLESIPTDYGSLLSLYRGLPKMVPLEEARGAFTKTNADELDAKRLCLLGKAYLGSIYVERNIERGVELLSRSLDRGEVEAGKELVRLYHLGIGRKLDLEQAIKIQEKVIELIVDPRERIFEKERLISILVETRRNENLEKAKKVAYENVFSAKGMEEERGIVIHNLAYVMESLSLLMDENCLEEAEGVIKKLPLLKEEEDRNTLSSYADMMLEIGMILYQKGRDEEAWGYFQSSLLAYEKLSSISINPHLYNFAMAIIKVSGIMAHTKGREVALLLEKAIKAYSVYTRYYGSTDFDEIEMILMNTRLIACHNHIEGFDINFYIDEVAKCVERMVDRESTVFYTAYCEFRYEIAFYLFEERQKGCIDAFKEVIEVCEYLEEKMEEEGSKLPGIYYFHYSSCYYLGVFLSVSCLAYRSSLKYLLEAKALSEKNVGLSSYRLENAFHERNYLPYLLIDYVMLGDRQNALKYLEEVEIRFGEEVYSISRMNEVEHLVISIALAYETLGKSNEIEPFIERLSRHSENPPYLLVEASFGLLACYTLLNNREKVNGSIRRIKDSVAVFATSDWASEGISKSIASSLVALRDASIENNDIQAGVSFDNILKLLKL